MSAWPKRHYGGASERDRLRGLRRCAADLSKREVRPTDVRNDEFTTDAETRIREIVDREHARQVAFLAALVRTPSDNPPGDAAPIAAVAADLLTAMGWEVELHHVPSDIVSAHGLRSIVNLVVRRAFSSDGPVIALNAHGDVVPPGGGWTVDPYGAEIRDNHLYGRGAAVSKSDIATYAFALHALERCGASLRGRVELHVTFDEETGGVLGPGWLLKCDLSRPDLVICAGATHAIVAAHNGCLHLEVEVVGRSGHAAWPDTGVDAIEAATIVMAALYRERATYAPAADGVAPTAVIGTIEGGTAVNVVPERVRFRIERRVRPCEDPERAEAQLRDVIAAAAVDRPDCRIVVRRLLLARPLVRRADQDGLVDVLRRHGARVLGQTPAVVASPLFTDARLYQEAGCATVLFGAGPRLPRDANGHRADEHVSLDDLRAATEIGAASPADLLSAERAA